MNYPLVSVIIPVRNCCEYIHEAISSILMQGITSCEIIVIDDGSTDYDYSQLELIDRRIRVIRLSGIGVSFARNTGMEIASGKYIAFLDADDVWFPGKIEAQIRYFCKNPHVGCVFGRFIKWQKDVSGTFPPAEQLWRDCRSVEHNEPERSGYLYGKLLSGLLVGMNTAVIRREVFEQVGGFDESMRIGEDHMFWLKISRIYEIHSLDTPVALYRIHSSSAMNRIDETNYHTRILRTAIARWGLKNPDNSTLNKSEFDQQIGLSEFNHGYNHFWRGNPSVARRSFALAILKNVHPIKSSAYWAASLAKSAFTPRPRQKPL